MDLSTFTNDQLITEAMDTKGHADELYARLNDIKAELLRRHKENGEVVLESHNAQSSLRREAFSEAWLKRQYGMGMADIPADCLTEKVTPVIDWEKTGRWMEQQGMPLEITYGVTLKYKPMKA